MLMECFLEIPSRKLCSDAIGNDGFSIVADGSCCGFESSFAAPSFVYSGVDSKSLRSGRCCSFSHARECMIGQNGVIEYLYVYKYKL